VRHRLKIGVERPEQFVLQVAVIGVGQAAAELGFDLEIGLARRATKEAVEHLLGVDWIAMPRQHIRVGAAGNDFAVDQHAVAVENDELNALALTGLVQWMVSTPLDCRGSF
jgi:hypothetical protein